MQSAAYSEFVGIAPRTASLIETFRQNPDETKDVIIFRALSYLIPSEPVSHDDAQGKPSLDLGEGVKLEVGERLYLFLSLEAKKAGIPDGVAIVGSEGLLVNDSLIKPSRGSYIHPAMVHLQKLKNHVNDKGEIISLSAFRQWHVMRGNKLVPLLELKDPKLARTRRKHLDTSGMSAAELLQMLDL